MSRYLRTLLIVLGMTILLTAAGLALVLSSNEAPASTKVETRVAVMVAARPIVAGNRITSADIGWEDVERSAVPAGALERSSTSEAGVVGTLALRNLVPGELLTEKLFGRAPDAATLAASLNPGWRAVTITATAAQTSAGLLLPNDRVDLLLSSAPAEGGQVTVALPFTQSNGSALGVTTAVITNVRIIAMNGSTKAEDGDKDMAKSDAEDGGTITLEVLPEQVGMVLSAATSGQIAISLRSRLDAKGAAAQLVIPPAPPVRKAPSAAPGLGGSSAEAKRARAAPSVTIIRGGATQRAE